MRKIIFITLIILIYISLLISNGKKYGYNPKNFPEVLSEKDFEGASNIDRLYGFIGWDFHKKDFTLLSLEFLAVQAFDNHTEWPEKEKRPERFSPEVWLEIGKDPGLGIKELHKNRVTGKGISVAVIDKCINPNHQEFLGRIIYRQISTPSAKDFQYRLHFHGIACASILCGKNCGVAPDARLYYFSVPDDGNNSYNYCLAMEKLIEINVYLPEDKKIRVVSISDGISRKDKKIFETWNEIMKKAKENNIAVIYSDNTIHSVFTWGGCPPYTDRKFPENYDYAKWPKNNDEKHGEKIILPADFRATANNEDNTNYAYWGGDSGFSWAIPYFAGLVALAKSIDKDLIIEEIYKYIEDTKTLNKNGLYVVNPQGFIDAVKGLSNNYERR